MKKINEKPFLLFGIINVILMVAVALVLSAIGHKGASAEVEFVKLDFRGTYIADEEEFENIESFSEFCGEKHKKVVFEGAFSEKVPDDKHLILSLCDVFGTLEINGKVLATNEGGAGEATNTPGNSILYVSGADIPQDAQVRLTLRNPYSNVRSIYPMNDTIDMLGYGEKDVMYDKLLKDNTVPILVSLAICYLGLFTFTLAGLLWRDVLMRNLALAFLAVTGGIYVLTDSIYLYLPLWVDNPVMCMIIDEFTAYLLPIAAFLFVRQNLENKRTKKCMSIITLGAVVVAMAGLLLHIFGIVDMLKSQYYMFFLIDVGVLGVVICFVYEVFIAKYKNTTRVMLSLIPLFLSSVFDGLNSFIGFAPERVFMRVGLLLTIIIQIYILILETVKHNKEMLRYQEIQNEMLQMRVSIMVSQIQPHFLYNALTSIAQLCEKDPPRAKKATIEFADYLRRNMNSLKEQAPAPFEDELRHIKTYLSLEKMRFGDELNIVYDIETTDFLVPLLSVQPLVENAVKHGVGMKEDGGTVTISTREYEDRFEIKVSDDGVGFDTDKPYDDDRTHIGMENVRTRLKTLCNASVEIKSRVGEGTVSTIIIPKEDE